MCSGIHKRQRQNIIFSQINQKPVRFDMIFPKSLKISAQSMIMILCVKLLSLTEHINNIIQKRKIQTTLLHEFVTLFIC